MDYALLTRDLRLANRIADSLWRGAHCGERRGDRFADELTMLRALRRRPYDLILFDARCADATHNPVLSWRACHADRRAPVVVIGSFDAPAEMFLWYDLGAADVLTLPFDPNELYVRATLARRGPARGAAAPARLSVGPYAFDRDTGTVTLHGDAIVLTSREFAMAWLFFSNPGTCFNRGQVAKSIWGNERDCADRTIEQHIYKLRKKLALGVANDVALRTVYGFGYKLEVASCSDAREPEFAAPTAAGPHAAA
ncbi:response regulator transcription factor [Burkholderia cenocepacia]|uniref:response regulator transcription factor n=1 Tax=Burkholderia cenocepacia TaxID=95486 RepID=UPI002231C317|nr:response regulator transcription factor [Burkholderia cenocepacia]MCW3610630.1 response regulator transcription factor [Burkholderia cenocepacia]MCW5191710.1 response regulator transcription factor [Burkholderia cenocepacia]